MQQKEISRWLKAITIVLALMGAVFFLYIMPVLAMSWRDEKTIHSQKKMQNVFEISVTSHCCSQLCGLRELFFWQS